MEKRVEIVEAVCPVIDPARPFNFISTQIVSKRMMPVRVGVDVFDAKTNNKLHSEFLVKKVKAKTPTYIVLPTESVDLTGVGAVKCVVSVGLPGISRLKPIDQKECVGEVVGGAPPKPPTSVFVTPGGPPESSILGVRIRR